MSRLEVYRMENEFFKIKAVKWAISMAKMSLAKLEHGGEYKIAPEAERIINNCITELEALISK